ncbi:MAG TPA: UbiD family decarboxylase [Candidatus Binatia bacterium]|nr:UbiD family decarboxylase [Candidatus Binatia bacterium]
MPKPTATKCDIDMNRFRLRTFVEKLIDMGEVEIHDEPVPLSELSRIVETTPKAVLFRKAGPEEVELVSSVAGGRRRLAAAFGVTTDSTWKEYLKRLESPQPVVKVTSGKAPVHEIVMQGDDVDLSKLPFHPQHELDGGTYLASGIDYSIDPETGFTNVGCRRLSLRNRRELGINVTAPSDLKRIYSNAAARGQRLPISLAVGSHPLDFMAATMRLPVDEVTLVATLRGAPLPLVKCVTNDIYVPADVEMVFEGYLDEHGYHEPEGPYGETMGYYGPMHLDPVFCVTAVTMRRDVLYQTVLHGSNRILARADSANVSALRAEAMAMKALRGVIKEPVAAYSIASSGGNQNLRIAIRQHAPGEARKAIHAIFSALMNAKHVFVVDHDVDIFDDSQMEWALSTRFQADRDFVLVQGLPGMRMDPSLEGQRIGAKAGFDCTVPFGRKETVATKAATAPIFGGPPAGLRAGPRRFQTVREAVAAGPIYFVDIMRGLGSNDGREIALELDALREEGVLCRNSDGQYLLGESQKGATTVVTG